MRRSPAFSTDSRRLAGPVLVIAGVVVGLAAERAAFEWSDPRHWLPDLVVGLTFVGSGATTLRRRPAAGALLAATGFTRFLGNFDPSLLFLHRGPLVHLFVTSPGWRARSRPDLGAVTVGYLVAVLTPAWRSDGASVVLALALVGWSG